LGLRFYKMTGAGNDFIFIDNTSLKIKDGAAELARRLCPRGLSAGADGLVLLEPDEELDFRWRFFNSDGSEAEMCGNAGRCAARLAVMLGLAKEKLSFRTVAGVISAEVKGRIVKVEMTRPVQVRPSFDLGVDGRTRQVGFINTGVPHVVFFVDNVDGIDVAGEGPKVRFHQQFSPAGANVNWASVAEDGTVLIRTYERGVEAETLACGTGAVAVALIGSLRGLVESPTRVRVMSGEELIIHYPPNPAAADPWPGAIFMEGLATLVYTAELSEEVGL